jgi:hypothetical protein
MGISGPPTGKVLATLTNPTISITEVPQGAGLQYYIAFYTFITSKGWQLIYTSPGTNQGRPQAIPFHAYLDDASGNPIYELDFGMDVLCSYNDYYDFYQQSLPPNFFGQTYGASYHFDATLGWVGC